MVFFGRILLGILYVIYCVQFLVRYLYGGIFFIGIGIAISMMSLA